MHRDELQSLTCLRSRGYDVVNHDVVKHDVGTSRGTLALSSRNSCIAKQEFSNSRDCLCFASGKAKYKTAVVDAAAAAAAAAGKAITYLRHCVLLLAPRQLE
jgi:hypothetical protein